MSVLGLNKCLVVCVRVCVKSEVIPTLILVESTSKGIAIRDFLEGSSLNKGSSRKDAVKCEVIDCLNGVT